MRNRYKYRANPSAIVADLAADPFGCRSGSGHRSVIHCNGSGTDPSTLVVDLATDPLSPRVRSIATDLATDPIRSYTIKLHVIKTTTPLLKLSAPQTY